MAQCAVYARVSTDDQDCSRQVDELTAWAERMGWQVTEVAREHASGSKLNRIERGRLITLARHGLIDAILVSELSRWSRSVSDLISTLDQLAKWHCSIRALNGLDMDITTASGRLMLTIIGGMAEFERSLISERTRSGLAATKRRGTILGRKRGNHPTDRFRSAVVALRASGDSLREIARKMNLSVSTICRLLTNQATNSPD